MPDSSLPIGDAVALTRALVAVDSRNPTLVPGAPGEHAAAALLAATLQQWGFDVELSEAASGRPNVVATIGRGSHTLLLAGHLDTVGVEGMTHEPFDPQLRNGRIYGRGSADMKSGVAAMCAAAIRGAQPASCRVIVAAVCDEEYESLGMRALVASGLAADAAVLTEPTRLAIAPAHRGFAWVTIRFRGRAAHGSRYDIGVDAIRHAGLFLAELDALDAGALRSVTHPLLGRASVHASTISGGEGFSTYPGECVLRLERRTLPGESGDQAVSEVRALLARVAERAPELDASLELVTAQSPSDVHPSERVVRSLQAALEAEGLPVRIEGMSAWTDAAILNDAGIPAICFGPGDIGMAHAAEEFVEVSEIEQATAVLERLVRNWAN
ncbi:MAG TPA: ArgE/DapE family deacylase [Gemmatimonadaceae bacterium]